MRRRRPKSDSDSEAPVRQRTVTDLISVIVSTYNREDALDASLRSLAAQRERGFEVIVADDGSGAATAQVVAAWSSRLPRLAHVWHEDKGFRLAEIRNRAILKSTGEVCVFLDGDCIARPDFIAAHRCLAEPGWFVAGNRALMSAALTRRTLSERLELERRRLPAWIAARLRGDVNRLGPLFRLPLGPLRHVGANAWRSARGGNLAIWRRDLERVDGFDAGFSGWGREDSDIIIRLMRAGVRRKDGRFATGVLHLWHPQGDRSRLPDNERMLVELMRGDRVKAISGLSALAAAPAVRS
jgi:glycosyltransferase involved in cell wall biosynthesis